MDIGRPTDYDELTIPKALTYLATLDERGEVVPTKAGLSLYLGVHRDTVHEWGRQHSAFSDVLDQLEAQQQIALVSGGLSGRYNSPITKLLLHKHGYSDKQEVDHRSGDGSMSPRTLDDFYAELNGDKPDPDA